MKRQAACLVLAGICAALLVCGGCSGAGVPAERVRGDATQRLASDHLSALVLVKSWFALLYQREQQARRCEQVLNFEDLPDGSLRIWGTNTDCSQFDWVIRSDGSGSGTQTWPGGKSKTESWSTITMEGELYAQDLEQAYSDGTRIACAITWADAPSMPQTWDGSATLADGRAMTFVLGRTVDVQDQLTLALPDGSELRVRLPITWAEGAPFWPVFGEGASGTFRGAAGDEFQFRMTGQEDAWNRWQFTTSDDVQGAFTLGEDLSGSGQLLKGGTILGALRWTPAGTGTLELVSAASAEVTPSAAARDFQIDQWVSNVAALMPAPIY